MNSLLRSDEYCARMEKVARDSGTGEAHCLDGRLIRPARQRVSYRRIQFFCRSVCCIFTSSVDNVKQTGSYAADELTRAATLGRVPFLCVPLDITSLHAVPIPPVPSEDLEPPISRFIGALLDRPQRGFPDLGYKMHDPLTAWCVHDHPHLFLLPKLMTIQGLLFAMALLI
jgi:hypothetical protein